MVYGRYLAGELVCTFQVNKVYNLRDSGFLRKYFKLDEFLRSYRVYSVSSFYADLYICCNIYGF